MLAILAVAPGSVLTDYVSPLVATMPGVVYENMRFLHYVSVRAANVTFRNCEFVGPADTGFYSDGAGNYGYGLVNMRDTSAQNTLIERCTIHPRAATGPGFWWLVGVSVRGGGTATVQRCNIYHTVDGINAGDASGSRVNVYGNYIHDLVFTITAKTRRRVTRRTGRTMTGCNCLVAAGIRLLGIILSRILRQLPV